MSGLAAVSPKNQFKSALGIPLVGGTLDVFLSGTTTRTNTWQDKALTSLNTNPITLDSRGECLLWLDPTITYKLVLKDVLGVTQWTVDNVAGQFDASNVSFTQSGTGAVSRTSQDKMRERKSPEDFGAAADGSTDDFAKLTLAAASGFDIMLTPGKTYKCGGSVTITTAWAGTGTLNFTSGCLIVGSGGRAIGVKVRGNGKTNASHGIDTVSAADDVAIFLCDVRDTSLNGIRGRSATKLRIFNNDIDNCGDPATINVTFQGMGVYCDTCVDVEVDNNRITRTYGQAGVFMNACTDWQANGNKISRTFFRGMEAFGAATARGQMVGNHVTRCGDINNTASGVGCNGIFISGPTTPEAVLVQANYIAQVGENGIEGMGTFRGNTVVSTGFYAGLATPSKEGIFVSGGICEGNTVVSAAEEGIYAFRNVATSNMRIAYNTIINPAGTGLRVQMDQVAGVLSNSEIIYNTVHGENDAAQIGVEISTSAGGSYTASSNSLIGNKVFGRATNTVSGTHIQNHNSWNSEHSLTMTDGERRLIGSTLNTANGGFRRHLWSHAIDFDGTNFQATNVAQIKTYLCHDNNRFAMGAAPSATTGALTTAALSAFDRLRFTDTTFSLLSLPTSGSGVGANDLWNNNGLVSIGATSGGAVTQATSKATGVTLNKRTGQITLNAASLAATTVVSFTLTNSVIGADDVVVIHRKSGGTALAYDVGVDSTAAGSCVIWVKNLTAGALAEAVLLQFSVISGAIA